MRKLIFHLLTLSFLIGCSTTSNHNSADLIKGEWVWIESSGGIAGTTETPESIQKEITIKISDNTIKQFVNGTLESDRTYTIENRESAIFGDVKEMIIYENGFRQIFSTTGNQLFLIGDCMDCVQSEYQRE